jgi:hypothetical protein
VLALGSQPARGQCTATEIKKLLASDGALADNLGLSVAIAGDTAIVGAWLNDNTNGVDAGAAYIYQQGSGGANNWGEVKKLVASDGATLDAFGWSVQISGDRAIVGAYRVDGGGVNRGAAYIFERDSGGTDNWGEVKILTASNAANDDQFGYSVGISGTSAVVGAQVSDALASDSGSAYVYDKDSGGTDNWGEVTEITASGGAANYAFGRSVSIDGDTVAVGAYLDDATATGAGAAYVFDRDNGGADNWGEVSQLLASDGGDDDLFGSSVSIDGDRVVVGAPGHDLTVTDTAAGAAYVYGRDTGGADNWGQVTKLSGSGTSKNDEFGLAVSVDGDNVLVGSHSDTAISANNSGVAYAFGKDWGGTDNWGQSHKLTASDQAFQDRFGWSVGLSGAFVLSGATHNDDNGTNSGAAYIIDLTGSPVTYCTAGVSANGCTATLSAVGTPSATATTGFTVTASDVEGDKDGLYFFGTNGRQANNWGSSSSFQCLVTPVLRSGLIQGIGTPGLCDNSISRDLNALWCPTCTNPLKNPGAGALVGIQLWYRDPFSTSNQTTGLTNAMEFTVCP